MSGNLTDTAESSVLNYLTGNTQTAPVLPLKLALTTTTPTDSTPGTEVTGGSYARQTIAFPSSTAGAGVTNSADVVFSGMPSIQSGSFPSGVCGFEIWDSAGTPKRWWHGAPTANKFVNAGDDYKVNAGDISIAQD